MKKGLWALLILIMVAGLSLMVAFGDTSVPGSPQDPVVTKSYVDSKLSYAVLRLQSGQKLIGGEGTEIIVRSGEVKAIDNGEDGISDITGGQDLKSGITCKVNHLLLVPRNDGRGIRAVTEAYIMIRGTYTLN